MPRSRRLFGEVVDEIYAVTGLRKPINDQLATARRGLEAEKAAGPLVEKKEMPDRYHPRLIDLAEVMTADELRATFARAREIGLLDPEALRAARGRV